MPERKLDKDRETISSMFDSIAPVYDRLNHLLSFGIDRSWRRRLVSSVVSFCKGRGGDVKTVSFCKERGGDVKTVSFCKGRSGGIKVLDLACGTGDVSISLNRKGLDVTGTDISENMLAIARKKAPEICFMYGDASCLPFEDGAFDAVTIAFGIRNFDRRDVCIRELHRVLKAGGMLAIAEFSIPRNRLWRGIYSFYFRRILPSVGKAVSKQAYAYTYLPESSFDFPSPDKFCAELAEGGFTKVSARSMTGGVSYLYSGRK